MRESVNASFTEYEWKPIKKRMKELGMNSYRFFRYCVFKECGIEIESENQESDARRQNRGAKQEDRIVDDIT